MRQSLLSDLTGNLMLRQHPEPSSKFQSGDCTEQSQSVEGVLVVATVGPDTIIQLVELRDQERRRTRHGDLKAPRVALLKGRNRQLSIIDKCRLEPTHFAGHPVPVLAELGRTAAAASHCLGHQQVNGHFRHNATQGARSTPNPGLRGRPEAGRYEHLLEFGIRLQCGWVYRDVPVGRERGHSKINLASM